MWVNSQTRFGVVFAACLTVVGAAVSFLTDDRSYVVMLGLIALACLVAGTNGMVTVPGVLVRVAVPIWPAVYFASQFLRRIEDEILATALHPFAEQVAVPELRRLAVGLNVVRYIIRLALLWLIVWLVAPDLFVSTRSGLATLFQVLPAVIVAIFVLVVGSAYGIIQQLTSSFGLRAALALTEDERMRSNVIRPLILAAASILISAQVPDKGTPPDALTAAAETLALASVWVLLTAARGLIAIAGEYSGPTNFVMQVVRPVRTDLRAGIIDTVVFKVALLGEAIKMGLRRRDSVTVQSALIGLNAITTSYAEAAEENLLVRMHTGSDGVPRHGWLGMLRPRSPGSYGEGQRRPLRLLELHKPLVAIPNAATADRTEQGPRPTSESSHARPRGGWATLDQRAGPWRALRSDWLEAVCQRRFPRDQRQRTDRGNR
jgi:hypothetical protein